MVDELAMEFAATALWADNSYRSALWWEFFDAFPRIDVLARPRPARSAPSRRGRLSRDALRPQSWPACERALRAMTFASILFPTADDRVEAQRAPAFFVDLNVDQIVEAVTKDWADYNLKPFFQAPLNRIDAIRYRHEVFQDLENTTLFDHVRSFAQRMREVRQHLILTSKLYDQHHKEGWFLHAVELYCNAINGFAANLSTVALKSRGFLAFREYLTTHAAGSYFTSLVEETNALKADLSDVRYCVLVKDNAFTVRHYQSETDYSAEIEETFEKFQQGAVQEYRVKYRSSPDMNHIEAKVLEFVARLNPEPFSRLDDYHARHADFIDATIAAFDREIHFYAAYLEHAAKFSRAGLRFCYPHVSGKSKEVYDHEGFDLALAQKLIDAKTSIVCNDFFLKGRERIIVVSGPNQGGKTTFARTFGQLHYLASIGCPVPGREAQLFLFDQLFTHFEREEKVENLRGKLEDDLIRVHSILQRATSQSIIIMNEVFTSTMLQDEIFLSRNMMQKILDLDLLCVWVTFADELASFSQQTVSMVSTVVPENPTLRTFKIVRRPADGLAYAMAIAEKYRLTYRSLKERIKS
jgi:DNA mismatch repair protein MutS